MSAESWVEAEDFRQSVFSGADKTIDDRVRKLRIEPINFDEQDLRGRTLGSLGIHQGLGEDFKGMTNDSVLSSRSYAKADNNFTKIVPDLERVQSINSKFNILTHISGQYSHAPLVAGEEWAIGGMDSVHGYQAGQFLGDDGLTANLETSYTVFSTLKSKYNLLLFADHGTVWQMDPTVGQRERNNISGTGVGLDASYSDMLDARLDWGYPIGPNDGGGSTIYFQIKYSF
jgi:hemolysin activation/secretion protein